MSTSTNIDLFNLALSFINHTQKHLFITGKAGTGKTFLLKQVRENISKQYAVVAPTGVAALNAGGITIHSFFQLPPMDLCLGKERLVENIRFNAKKRLLLHNLELLIIDEVSMLRADTLDAIDAILRTVRQQPGVPFGGVQIVYIGDLLQLAPVVKDADWEVLRSHYKSPFLLDAKVFSQTEPVCLVLEKVYRQKDSAFICLLDRIREGSRDAETISRLNAYCLPHSESDIQWRAIRCKKACQKYNN